MRLRGRAALVTGAARGIGRAITQAFISEGASVVAVDRDEQGLAATARPFGTRCVSVGADVTDLAHHKELVQGVIQEFGRLDILVNNAAIQLTEPFLQAKVTSWDLTLDVNLKAPFFLAQAAAERMIQGGRGGVVINIASIHDSVALRNRSVYAITKGGMKMMTRSLAYELAEHGITVNAISPGAIETDMNIKVLSDPTRREHVLEKIPVRRIGTPQDIAGAAVFLASPEAAYINGATLYVDGGILTH